MGGFAPLGWRIALTMAILLSCTISKVAAGNAVEAENATLCKEVHGTPRVEASSMPHGIRALLHENWSGLDEDGNAMVTILSGRQVFAFFSHARSTFKEHLLYTFGVLAAWGQPADVRRAGLFHTAYSGDLFQFYVY